MTITNSLQQRWCIITQMDESFLPGLHNLEKKILASSVRIGQVDIAVWIHPAVQEYVDNGYSQIQPFWDRHLMIMERLQRWDDFVKMLFKNGLHTWERMDLEDAFSKDLNDTRQAYAERMLERLHNADKKVRMCMSLNRNLEAPKSAGKAGYNGPE